MSVFQFRFARYKSEVTTAYGRKWLANEKKIEIDEADRDRIRKLQEKQAALREEFEKTSEEFSKTLNFAKELPEGVSRGTEVLGVRIAPLAGMYAAGESFYGKVPFNSIDFASYAMALPNVEAGKKLIELNDKRNQLVAELLLLEGQQVRRVLKKERDDILVEQKLFKTETEPVFDGYEFIKIDRTPQERKELYDSIMDPAVYAVKLHNLVIKYNSRRFRKPKLEDPPREKDKIDEKEFLATVMPK